MSNLYRVTYVDGGTPGSTDVVTNSPQEAAGVVAATLATPIEAGTALILGASELAVDLSMDSTYWTAAV